MIETKKLLSGDIILTTQKSTLSKAICKTTNSNFSHVMIYVGEGVYIHANKLGVRSGTLPRLFFKKAIQVRIIRLKIENKVAAEAASVFSRTQIGKQYSTIEAIKSKRERNKLSEESRMRQFCSRLVAQAYAYSGIKLVFNPNYCYPQDIADSPLMIEVKNCVRNATIEELEIRQIYDPGEQQNKTISLILSQVRKVTNEDIQTLEQIAYFLIYKPHYDAAITKIMSESGYLDLWLVDIDNWYWRYDEKEFIKLDIPKSQILEIAVEEISSGIKLLDLYKFMFTLYSERIIFYPFSYYILIRNLYLKLIKITEIRVNTAKLVLDEI